MWWPWPWPHTHGRRRHHRQAASAALAATAIVGATATTATAAATTNSAAAAAATTSTTTTWLLSSHERREPLPSPLRLLAITSVVVLSALFFVALGRQRVWQLAGHARRRRVVLRDIRSCGVWYAASRGGGIANALGHPERSPFRGNWRGPRLVLQLVLFVLVHPFHREFRSGALKTGVYTFPPRSQGALLNTVETPGGRWRRDAARPGVQTVP